VRREKGFPVYLRVYLHGCRICESIHAIKASPLVKFQINLCKKLDGNMPKVVLLRPNDSRRLGGAWQFEIM
jgi:hypothetical protein